MCYGCVLAFYFNNILKQNVNPGLLFQFHFMVGPWRPLFTKTVFCCLDGLPYVSVVQYFT